MKSALNTKTYNFNDISVAIWRRVISQRFLVVVVVIIALFVVADVVVVALVVTVIFFFPCVMGLPPAIPGLRSKKDTARKEAQGSYRGSRLDPDGPPV